jgi:hypothetical protein
LKYVDETKDLAIEYGGLHVEQPNQITVYADADFACKYSPKRKSRSGYILYLNNGPILWHSSFQTKVAQSTSESELYSMFDAVQEAKWVKNFLFELGFQQDTITCYEDNTGCIDWIERPRSSTRMKALELKYYGIRDDNVDEVFAISLVESPAIESDFVYFDKEEVMFASIDRDQQMLIGAVLIPEKKILRIDGEGQPYHVFFSKETVKKLAQNYLMKKYTDSATLEHDSKIKGVHLVESWIKEGQLDKSNQYGLALPVGSWVGLFKITDSKLWKDYVKTGKVKGFSIEGLFEHKLVEASYIDELLEKNIDDLSDAEAEIALAKITAIIKKDKRFKKKEKIEFQSYNDYPQSVRDAARIAREQNEKVGGKCMTLVGKRRSADLEAGRPLSRETIARMVSYLSRAKSVYEQNKSNRESCSYIAYKGWGGETALTWAENKLKQIDMEANPSIPNSSYAGEPAKGKGKYIHPALIGND